MENVTYLTDSEGVEHIIIDRGNGEFTSMLKSTWDELEAAKENSTIHTGLVNTDKPAEPVV